MPSTRNFLWSNIMERSQTSKKYGSLGHYSARLLTAHGNHHWGKKKVQANPPIWGEMYILWQHNKPSDQIYPGLLSEKKR